MYLPYRLFIAGSRRLVRFRVRKALHFKQSERFDPQATQLKVNVIAGCSAALTDHLQMMQLTEWRSR